MSRSLLKNPEEEFARTAAYLLNGTTARPVNLTEVSRATGIPLSSLYKKRKYPQRLTMVEGLMIAEAIGMTNQEWCELRDKTARMGAGK